MTSGVVLLQPFIKLPLTSFTFSLRAGIRCQMCEDGYYGDPLGTSGAARPCMRCNCNGNVDFNSVGTCDHVSGRCLKCLGHTEGEHCQRCQWGYYGDALNQASSQKCKREFIKGRKCCDCSILKPQNSLVLIHC